jgi:aspartyl-tRNA(Asn)/glutamyl-tRNA(Gln) amidotransferase subunit A
VAPSIEAKEGSSNLRDLTGLDIAGVASLLASRRLTASELLEVSMARADDVDPKIHCYARRMDESAREAAQEVDRALESGNPVGSLAGIPIAVKDIITTRFADTTAGSHVVPPEYGNRGDAVVVERLRAAGAVITGKASTMEYAMGMTDESQGFPVPANPWDLRYWAGGSSSGSANGVQAGVFIGALGTDTGGSIRIPAAWCGVTGLKPTFGRVPNTGCIPLGYSQDTIGPMARSARDCAVMLSVLAGHDVRDPNASLAPIPDYVRELDGSVAGLKLAVDRSRFTSESDEETFALFDAAIETLESSGAIIEEVALPFRREVTTAGQLGFVVDGFAAHRREAQVRWTDFGSATRLSMLMGMTVSASDYIQALRVRRVGMRETAILFQKYDAILTPTCSAPATIGYSADTLQPRIYTAYWSTLGNPAVSVPMGFTKQGLPTGLQIACKPFAEAMALKIADAFQSVTDFHHEVSNAL